MANDQDLAGLPEDVREALSYFADAETALEGEGHNGTMYTTVRAELVRLARENAESREYRRWNVERSPGGIVVCYGDHDKSDACEWENFVPIERAERAEAELAALKRSTQGTVQAVRPQADGCYLVEVRCDSAGVASLFSQCVALLPVGGE